MDDLIITGPNLNIIENFAKEANSEIKLQSIGTPSNFLGMEIEINKERSILKMHQSKYTTKCIERFNKLNVRRFNTPVISNLKLQKSDKQASADEIKLYQQQIGALIYLAIKTRPDIIFGVNLCSRFMSNPGKEYWNALERIWGYLVNSPNLGICYNLSSAKDSNLNSNLNSNSNLNLIGFSDAS